MKADTDRCPVWRMVAAIGWLRAARIELWWVTADGDVADAVAETLEVSAT
jgi:hypothetical protein